MVIDPEIPVPVRFNALKHHQRIILQFLDKATLNDVFRLSESICSNYIDVYTGKLTPEDLGFAVINYLKRNQIMEERSFSHWLSGKRGYHQVTFGDGSEWIIRKSNNDERYIHIHPAKAGPHVIRFKGSTLKTAYRLKKESTGKERTLSLGVVNHARAEIGLSPVKKLEPGKGILKCWNLFFVSEGKTMR